MDTQLKAGRELDALIAERVMDECPWQIWFSRDSVLRCTDINGISYFCANKEQAESYIKDFPVDWNAVLMEPQCKEYSSDISAAWEVVEKMRHLGWSFDLNLMARYTVVFRQNYLKDTDRFSSKEDTAPHAICLAALKAIEGPQF